MDIYLSLCDGTQQKKDVNIVRLRVWDDTGKSAIVVRASYGLKSVGASFMACLAQYMWELGYVSFNADWDLWVKPEYRPEDKLAY